MQPLKASWCSGRQKIYIYIGETPARGELAKSLFPGPSFWPLDHGICPLSAPHTPSVLTLRNISINCRILYLAYVKIVLWCPIIIYGKNEWIASGPCQNDGVWVSLPLGTISPTWVCPVYVPTELPKFLVSEDSTTKGAPLTVHMTAEEWCTLNPGVILPKWERKHLAKWLYCSSKLPGIHWLTLCDIRSPWCLWPQSKRATPLSAHLWSQLSRLNCLICCYFLLPESSANELTAVLKEGDFTTRPPYSRPLLFLFALHSHPSVPKESSYESIISSMKKNTHESLNKYILVELNCM